MLRVATLVLPLVAIAIAGCSDDDDDASSKVSSAQRAQYDAEIADLEEKVKALEAQIATSDSAKQTLQAQLDAAKTALAAAEVKLAQGDDASITAQLATAKKALADLQAALDVLPGSVTLETKFAFGSTTDFQLDTPYELSSGVTFSFGEVRYWLSNVTLAIAGGGTFTVPNAYYLVEVMKEQVLSNGAASTTTLPASRRESLVIGGVPKGAYAGIAFAVGVDQAHNDNLSLGGGELHVLKNMTSDNGWMWFTSYIFGKVRGSVVEGSNAPIAVAWETGTNANYRTVSKTFAAPVNLGAGKTAKVSLRADVKKLFTSLDPRTVPTIKAAQTTERTTLSDNWASAFELVSATSP